MNAPVFFSSAGDERGTPQDFFDKLHAEFQFDIDCAASPLNKKCELYFGEGSELGTDALEQDWGGGTCFLNPPYSTAGAFVAKAREEADKGATVVMVLPVRSDTKWWHTFVWDKDARGCHEAMQAFDDVHIGTKPDGNWRPGVRVRLLRGRLNFELHVPATLRTWIKSELAATQGQSEDVRTAMVKSLVAVTGLPKMAIERIDADEPDDCLMDAAPFPSCVVIFTKVAQ